jgi:hypothetical protein
MLQASMSYHLQPHSLQQCASFYKGMPRLFSKQSNKRLKSFSFTASDTILQPMRAIETFRAFLLFTYCDGWGCGAVWRGVSPAKSARPRCSAKGGAHLITPSVRFHFRSRQAGMVYFPPQRSRQ